MEMGYHFQEKKQKRKLTQPPTQREVVDQPHRAPRVVATIGGDRPPPEWLRPSTIFQFIYLFFLFL
jgi:hypothetical protein